MEFAQPLAMLLALLALPVLWLTLRRRSGAVPLPGIGGLAGAPMTWRLRAARVLPLLRAAAIVLLAVAVAGPRVGQANAVVQSEGIDIAITLDISSSMTSSRLQGDENRLEGAKRVIREFIAGRENDRIGLVVFQEDALAVAPPTLDYRALDEVVAGIESGLLPDGTGIGVGLAQALNMLEGSTAASRIVVLLTDGEHNADSITPEDATALAAALRIRVYTIGIVTEGVRGPRRGIDEELLEYIADETGGRYFDVESADALAAVYAEIGELETSRIGRDRFEEFTQLAPWFAIPAAVLLALDLALAGTWLRRGPP
jgi:Ca-activated chloride channel family protein